MTQKYLFQEMRKGRRSMKNSLILADAEKTATSSALTNLRGYGECVVGAKEMGVIHGVGLQQKSEVKDTAYMQEVYQMGRGV